MLPRKLLCLAFILTITQVHGNTIGFVIDNTSSMRKNTNVVKDIVSKIADIYSELRFVDNYAIVKVADPEYLTETRLTYDRYIFDVDLNTLDGSNLDYNWDCREPILFGVKKALNVSDFLSHLYVFVDAPTKDDYRSKKIITQCRKLKTQITFIVMGNCLDDPNEFWVYNDIARKCYGNVLVVSRDELYQIPDYIRETVRGCPKYLRRVKTPANRATDVEFEINDTVNYVVISASGFNVNIYISLPKWKQERLIWTDNFKAVKILHPAVTNHIVSVSGEAIDVALDVMVSNRDCCVDEIDTYEMPTEVALEITTKGKSDIIPSNSDKLDFDVMTEVKATKQFNVISTETIDLVPEIATEVDLGVSNAEISIKNIERTEIPTYTTSQNTFERLLEEPTESASFVSTAMNSDMSSEVSRNLIDTENSTQSYSKIITTTTSAVPDWLLSIPSIGYTPPEVEISEGTQVEVPYNGSVLLVCKVHAYPTPNIEWIDVQRIPLPSDTLMLYPPSVYISFLRLTDVTEDGFYSCFANNNVGEDLKYIEVFVIHRPNADHEGKLIADIR